MTERQIYNAETADSQNTLLEQLRHLSSKKYEMIANIKQEAIRLYRKTHVIPNFEEELYREHTTLNEQTKQLLTVAAESVTSTFKIVCKNIQQLSDLESKLNILSTWQNIDDSPQTQEWYTLHDLYNKCKKELCKEMHRIYRNHN